MKEKNAAKLNNANNLRNQKVEVTLYFSYKFFKESKKNLDKKFDNYQLKINEKFQNIVETQDSSEWIKSLQSSKDNTRLFYTGVEPKIKAKYEKYLENAKAMKYKEVDLVKIRLDDAKRLLAMVIWTRDNNDGIGHWKVLLYPFKIDNFH